MGKFDLGDSLAAALKSVSGSDTAAGREQIEYIDLTALDADASNFYALDALDDLAANIELVGLQQPLRVRPNPDMAGRYIIVSGHRRRAALAALVEEGREDLRTVPCIVEKPAASAAMQELRLIYANSGTRKISPADLSRQAERVEILLYQLKEEGVEFPGRMRDHVAEACKVAPSKLATLKRIRENLIPEYMALFERDKLPETAAYALARLPEDFQRRMARVLPEAPSGVVAEKVLATYNDGWRWEPDLQCPDGKACKRGDSFLRRDCEASSYGSFCGGKTCCLKCAQANAIYSPCERMCSKAKEQRKADKAKEEEKNHQRRQKEGRPYQKETQRHAKRLLRAIDAAGLAADAAINWNGYGATYTVSTIRQWAAGEFDDPAGWYHVKLHPKNCGNAARLAKQLHCSTDFLLGLTDELRPGEATEEPDRMDAAEDEDATPPEAPADSGTRWIPGDQPPAENCDAACIFCVEDSWTSKYIAKWSGGTWRFPHGQTIDADCLWWFPLPRDPEVTL